MTNIIWQDQSEKVTPVWADRIVQTDSASSHTTVWSTITNMATAIFGLKTTANLTENTNLYYTEARVTANTTVAWKSNTVDVLEKTNTTAFTPTADYHPATKKYVDDSWVNINWLTAKTTPVDADEFIIYDSAWLANKKSTLLELKTVLAGTSALIDETITLAATWTTETITVTHSLWYVPSTVNLISNLVTRSWDNFFTPAQQSIWHYVWWSQVCSYLSLEYNVWATQVPFHWQSTTSAWYLRYTPSSSTNAFETFTINITNITTTTLDIQIVKTLWTAYAVNLSFTGTIS